MIGDHGLRQHVISGVQTGKLTNHGGPVQTNPKVYIDYWGWTGSNPDPDGEKTYLTNFLSSVGNSNWLKTLTQYSGAGANVTYAGSWSDTSSTVPAGPTLAQFETEASRADTHWGLTSTNDQVVVALPNGVHLAAASGNACSYHSYASGVPFTAFPYLAAPYAPVPGFYCGRDLVNAGTALNMDAVSLFEGHELAESITDPLLNAWYQTNLAGEVGDKCEFYNDSDIVTSKGTFAVQPLWSNASNWCTLGYDNGPGSWGSQVLFSNQSTSAAPSMTTSGGTVYMAFKGHSSGQVYVMDNPGNGWTGNYSVTGANTSGSPAVAVLNGRVYVLWTASSAPNHVFESSASSVGGSWSAPVIPGGGSESSAGPSVCSTGSRLIAAYKGTGSSTQIYLSVFNGTSWGSNEVVPGATSDFAPALACTTAGTATVVWTNTSDHVAYETFTGTGFANEQTFNNVLTNAAPGATNFDAHSNAGLVLSTVVVWKADTSNEIDYTVHVGSGNGWGTITQVPQALTTHGPTVTSDADWGADPGDLTLYVGWEGQSEKALGYSASNTP